MSHCDINDKSEPSLDAEGCCACAACRGRRMTRTPTTKDMSDAGVTRIVMPPTSPASSNYQLFEHMANEHALTLLESELETIIAICERILKARRAEDEGGK